MPKFKLHWLHRKIEVVEGETVAQAMTLAGYSQGAVRALDWYEPEQEGGGFKSDKRFKIHFQALAPSIIEGNDLDDAYKRAGIGKVGMTMIDLAEEELSDGTFPSDSWETEDDDDNDEQLAQGEQGEA
ncbi:MAG: hypothetical protein ABIH21_00630 [Patescibacteria group bacterium]